MLLMYKQRIGNDAGAQAKGTLCDKDGRIQGNDSAVLLLISRQMSDGHSLAAFFFATLFKTFHQFRRLQ